MNAKPIETNKSNVCPKIWTSFPYSINVTYERNHWTLKMESNFHVKILHVLHNC